MTELPRVMISMTNDIETAVERMKKKPENRRVPKSQLLCRLIRQGIENDEELSGEKPEARHG